ncbi:hypothetical protein [Bacillus altitudinis]
MKVGEEWEGGTFEFLFHNGSGKPFYYTTPTARWDKFRKKLR